MVQDQSHAEVLMITIGRRLAPVVAEALGWIVENFDEFERIGKKAFDVIRGAIAKLAPVFRTHYRVRERVRRRVSRGRPGWCDRSCQRETGTDHRLDQRTTSRSLSGSLPLSPRYWSQRFWHGLPRQPKRGLANLVAISPLLRFAAGLVWSLPVSRGPIRIRKRFGTWSAS